MSTLLASGGQIAEAAFQECPGDRVFVLSWPAVAGAPGVDRDAGLEHRAALLLAYLQGIAVVNAE